VQRLLLNERTTTRLDLGAFCLIQFGGHEDRLTDYRRPKDWLGLAKARQETIKSWARRIGISPLTRLTGMPTVLLIQEKEMMN
jgi:hypothetical protein